MLHKQSWMLRMNQIYLVLKHRNYLKETLFAFLPYLLPCTSPLQVDWSPSFPVMSRAVKGEYVWHVKILIVKINQETLQWQTICKTDDTSRELEFLPSLTKIHLYLTEEYLFSQEDRPGYLHYHTTCLIIFHWQSLLINNWTKKLTNNEYVGKYLALFLRPMVFPCLGRPKISLTDHTLEGFFCVQ